MAFRVSPFVVPSLLSKNSTHCAIGIAALPASWAATRIAALPASSAATGIAALPASSAATGIAALPASSAATGPTTSAHSSPRRNGFIARTALSLSSCYPLRPTRVHGVGETERKVAFGAGLEHLLIVLLATQILE